MEFKKLDLILWHLENNGKELEGLLKSGEKLTELERVEVLDCIGKVGGNLTVALGLLREQVLTSPWPTVEGGGQ